MLHSIKILFMKIELEGESMKKYAPIVIFAYNRADMLEQLIDSLEENIEIGECEGYIFVDVPVKEKAKDVVYNKEVLEFLEQYKKRTLFKNLKITIASEHKGLAKSIIDGVTQIICQHGKAIVLEDDLLVSNDFIDYMQRALDYYENDDRVWSISAHSPKLKALEKYPYDVYLIPRVESLGWGTWKDRWEKTDWDVSTYRRFANSPWKHIVFNIGGNDLTNMLKMQMKNSQFDSWAIRWCYQEYLEKKYTIYPRESRVLHCGNDERSTHGVYICSQSLKPSYSRCMFEKIKLNRRLIYEFRRDNSVSFPRKVLEKLDKVIFTGSLGIRSKHTT